MSKLLINENPLVLLPSLAVAVGLNQALFLQQVHYWLQVSKMVHDGKKWTYNTIEEWHTQFPFFSKSTINRAIAGLVESGLLLVEKLSDSKYDRTNYYTIDYEKLDNLTCQTEAYHCVNLTQSNMAKRHNVTETSTETSTEKKNSACEDIILDSADNEPAYVIRNQPASHRTDSFQMSYDFKPTKDFEVKCKFAGKDISKFTDDTLKTFIIYNMASESYKTQKQWESALLTWFINHLAKSSRYQPSGNSHSTECSAKTQSDHIEGQYDDAVKNRASTETTKAFASKLKTMLSE